MKFSVNVGKKRTIKLYAALSHINPLLTGMVTEINYLLSIITAYFCSKCEPFYVDVKVVKYNSCNVLLLIILSGII